MSEPQAIYSVHEQDTDGIRGIVGLRLTEAEAKTLADEAFQACESTEVWVEEWASDGYWYDSTVIYRKERSK